MTSQPATPPPAAPRPAPAPAPAAPPRRAAPAAPGPQVPLWGTAQPRAPRPTGGPDEGPQPVGGFSPGGNGAGGGNRGAHPAQQYGGIGSPAGHRAWAVAIAKHEMAGAAGAREADAMLNREIKRAPNLTTGQKMKAAWKLRRAHRKMAGAMEASAKAAANVSKVRSEVNGEILSARRRTRPGGFTVQ